MPETYEFYLGLMWRDPDNPSAIKTQHNQLVHVADHETGEVRPYVEMYLYFGATIHGPGIGMTIPDFSKGQQEHIRDIIRREGKMLRYGPTIQATQLNDDTWVFVKVPAKDKQL